MNNKQHEYEDWLREKQKTQLMCPEKLTPIDTLSKGTIHWLTPNYFEFIFTNPFVSPNLEDVQFFTGHEAIYQAPIVLSVKDGHVCVGIQFGSAVG